MASSLTPSVPYTGMFERQNISAEHAVTIYHGSPRHVFALTVALARGIRYTVHVKVYVFGPSTCKVVSSVGDCQSNLLRPIVQEWAANSPCKGVFDDPVHGGVSCGKCSRYLSSVNESMRSTAGL